MNEPPKKPVGSLPLAYRVVALQGVVLGIVTLGLLSFDGPYRSFLVGGACALLPNAWLAWRVQRRAGENPDRDARGLLLGAFGKIALTFALLIVALSRLNDLNAPAFFAGFIVALATHHAALVLDTGDGREA